MRGVVLAAVAVAAPLSQAQEQIVTGPEIQSQWIGKDVLGRTNNGARVLMTLAADGSAKLLIGAVPDSGTWRPWEQGYCTTWKGLRGGQEMCFTVKRDGERFQLFRPDGSSGGVVEVK
jgi:hypothetical protein